MEYKDYYKTLGIPRDADTKAVATAFRKLARKYHPDVNPDKAEAEKRFKEINEAYEVLRDPEKRRKYDQLGADWERHQGAGRGFDWGRYQAGPGRTVHRTRYTNEDLRDLFGNRAPFSDFFQFVFGGAGAQGEEMAVRAQDLEQPVTVSLAEAFSGTTRRFRKPDGKTLEVKIPAGVEDGSRVRVKGQGIAGTRGATGDLWLVVSVAPDPRFERRGDDLHATAKVGLYEMVLGAEVSVSLLKGRAKVKIPAGTQNGTELRLKGQGMPKLGQPDSRGDLYVRVEVELPAGLSAKEKELFEELARQRQGSKA